MKRQRGAITMITVKKRVSQSYEEMAKIGHEHYSDQGFCTCVAVASAAQVNFGKARSALMNTELHGDEARKHGRGGLWETVHRTLTELGVKVLDAKVREDGKFKRVDPSHPWFYRSLVSLENEKPKGLYMLFTDGHISFMKDGVINDWSSKRARRQDGHRTGCRKRVLLVWELEREFEEVEDLMMDKPLKG